MRPESASTGYINPVCGALVDPAHAVSTLAQRGQTHYFCCQGCRVEFERDPEKYLEIGARMLGTKLVQPDSSQPETVRSSHI